MLPAYALGHILEEVVLNEGDGAILKLALVTDLHEFHQHAVHGPLVAFLDVKDFQFLKGPEPTCRSTFPRPREVPSDSEDSELEDESDSGEEWLPDSGLTLSVGDCQIDNETTETNEDENEDEDEVFEPEEDNGLPRWRTPHNANFPDYPEWQGSLPRSEDVFSPVHYFKMFFSDNILSVITEQSNLYAIQCNPKRPLNLSTKELEQFIGTVVYMSLFGLPATRMFWSKASRVHQVADTMSLNRWEAIKKALHFNDNEAIPAGSPDPLYKIRPLVDHLTSKLQSIPMSEKLAVDEQIVPFKGKNKNKQYLPAKPKKWGYKILILASSEGIPHNFEIYTGRIEQPPELADIGASGNVVLRLAQPIPNLQNHKLFFDNWFTSVPLVLTLAQDGIHSAGTVRSNRLPGVNLMSDAELKRSGRGSFTQKTAMVGETTLYVVKWRDCFEIGLRKEDQMKLYTFKSYIAESLCKTGKNMDRKRGRPTSTITEDHEEKCKRGPTTPIPVPEVRLDATAHWMVKAEKKARCKLPGCKDIPKTQCRKCGVHLCFTATSNCFLLFHTE
ncbi:hypothetical protein WMY93_017283 [Mugilogobius chulae]|uniref:PiggyBac transposable element-derived protein domain-containing protein n=1 Tax=Mugilogobius chulae TaxID=88201 RepID=A0AAW0NZE0_9GOBI